MPATKSLDAMTAREIMKPEPVTAEPWMTARQFAELLDSEEISGVPVVDQQGHLVGIASRADLIHRSIALDEDYDLRFIFESLEAEEDDTPPMEHERQLRVEDFMVEAPITGAPGESVRSIAQKLVSSRVHRVIIVEGQIPIGIISSLDIAALVAEGAA